MRLNLKKYQREVLSNLADFFRQIHVLGNISAAYDKVTDRQNMAHMSAQEKIRRRYTRPYNDEGLASCPHVCVRVPTAGGKTLMAAHSVKIAAEYLGSESVTVLWLAPTSAIAQQTLSALRNIEHPYRLALEESFGNNRGIVVTDIENGLDSLTISDFTDKVCIIVTTYSMFRVRKTAEKIEGENPVARKVYEANERYQAHFEQFMPQSSEAPSGLERDEHGEIVQSFANLLHLVQPVVMLDEAHNFLTKLSKEVLQRINPSCILEWTATPRDSDTGSPLHNVLVSIDAKTLCEEEMIKFPLIVGEHSDWRESVAASIKQREELAAVANEQGEPIRPIVLYQATNINGDVPPQILKTHLMESESIPEHKIKIATADIHELDGLNLLAADCPVEHIITINALREGWDCPFAYVLCSVANINSAVAIEQLLGRIMRMPFAQKRKDDSLNQAYVHAPKDNKRIGQIVSEVIGSLKNLGMEEYEAKWQVRPLLILEDNQATLLDNGFTQEFELTSEPDFSQLDQDEKNAVQESIVVSTKPNGGFSVVLNKPISDEAVEAVANAASPENREQMRAVLTVTNRQLARNISPVTLGKKFQPLPKMLFYSPEANRQVVANAASLLEVAEFNNVDDIELIDGFSSKDESDFYRVFIEAGRIQSKRHQMPVLFMREDTLNSEDAMSAFLAKEIHKHYEDGRFFTDTLETFSLRNVKHLLANNITIEQMSNAKYYLVGVLAANLKKHQLSVLEKTAQQYIFKNEDLRCDYSFVFPENERDYMVGNAQYQGFHFDCHYYPIVGDMGKGEEFQCAKIIDKNDHVRYWIRNVQQQEHSYSLPLSNGRNFYPDFVVQLDDDSILIVEYKGDFIAHDKDATMKRNIGEHLEKISGGKCFFLMPTIADNMPPLHGQISDKIHQAQELRKKIA